MWDDITQTSAQRWRESPIEVVMDRGVGGLWCPACTPSHSAQLPRWVPPPSAALWNVGCSPLCIQCWHISCPQWAPLCSSLRTISQQRACSSFCGCRSNWGHETGSKYFGTLSCCRFALGKVHYSVWPGSCCFCTELFQLKLFSQISHLYCC